MKFLAASSMTSSLSGHAKCTPSARSKHPSSGTHKSVIPSLQKRHEYPLAHVFRDDVPIIFFDDHRSSGRDDRAHLFRVFHDVLHLLRNLLGRIFVDREARYRFPLIALLIEKKVGDATLLSRDNRKPRGHGFYERVPHAFRAARSNENVARFEILREVGVPYLPDEGHPI